MTPAAVTRLNKHIQTAIPLAGAAGVQLRYDSDHTLTAHAPLAGNGNPHGSVFGGSQYVLALTAGYAQTVLLVEDAGIDATIVVSHAEVDYLQPLHHDMLARVEAVDEHTLNRFLKALHRHGRGRLRLAIGITADGSSDRITAFELHVHFVATVTDSGNQTPAGTR